MSIIRYDNIKSEYSFFLALKDKFCVIQPLDVVEDRGVFGT